MNRRNVSGKISGSILMAAAAALALTPLAHARDWTAGSGDFGNAANWSPAGVPGAGETVFIKPPGGGIPTVRYAGFAQPPETYVAPFYNAVELDMAGGILLFNMDAGYDIASQTINAGVDGLAFVTQSSGDVNLSHYIELGLNAGSQGHWNISGGTITAAQIFAGYDGRGEFNQTGGTVTIGNGIFVGYGASSTGVYKLSGGSLSVNGTLGVGYNGTGSFTFSGDTTQLTAKNITIGQGGTGTFIHNSGTVNV